jgi:hypothetical protein
MEKKWPTAKFVLDVTLAQHMPELEWKIHPGSRRPGEDA